MSSLNRRDFLRAVGVGSTATAAACAYDPKVPYENIMPYVAQPEDLLPGLATYYATACSGCASACGAIVRAKEGRVVNIEGNPDHPNGPGLCSRGHYSVLATYAPDRLAGPMNGGKASTWDDAHAAIVAAIGAARAAGKSVAWLGGYRTGSVDKLLGEFGTVAGLRRVHWEPLGVESHLAASRVAFNIDAVPTYALEGAHTIVSFGMDFLGTAHDSMRMIKGWSKGKNPAIDGFVTRYVAIEPRVGVTSSQADLWLAPVPGTETGLALAIAKAAADLNHYAGPAAALLAGVDVAAAAQPGITEERIREIATWLTENPSVVLPGGSANAGTDATALTIATYILNDVCGNIGRSVQFGRQSTLGQVNSYAHVKELLDDARAGKIGVLFIDGANPVYHLASDDKAREALEAVDVVVQFADETDDSTVGKAILLPTGTSLETWGDASASAGIHVVQQPGMTPLKDTRALGEVVLALAKALSPVAPAEAAVPDVAILAVLGSPSVPLAQTVADWPSYVKQRWMSEIYPTVAGAPAEEAFWTETLHRGGVFQEPAVTGAALVVPALPTGAGALAGTDKALALFTSPNLGDGRHANIPWAQEMADPISTYFWTSWAEIHPKTVEALGLGPTDMLEVKTETGSIKLGYFASKGVREDSVAVLLGNGHKGMGRYATGRGVNPMDLLPSAVDAQSGALATHTRRATVKRVEGDSGVFGLVGHNDQDGRPLANIVHAEDAVAHLEGEPGSIVHIHEPYMDPRLIEAGITDMYPEPQHPTYRFSMAIDTNTCNGCNACVVACALENNTPFIGPDQVRKGRTMSWIRMDRFWEGEGENPDIRYLPAICQQCSHAPCEGVCPVLATYHNLDGLNAMIYNRCVGTRYCANNCPYTARRFNFHTWQWPESYHLMLNPDLSTREMGVMEKCTFCVQRLRAAKDVYRDVKQQVPDEALRKITACAAACPSESITFGNWHDLDGGVRKLGESPRAYTLLKELNTKPGVRYLARVKHTHGKEA